MNNNDVSTLQSLQNQKPLLQITQKLNANLIESISIKTLFQRYIIEFCSKKKENRNLSVPPLQFSVIMPCHRLE